MKATYLIFSSFLFLSTNGFSQDTLKTGFQDSAQYKVLPKVDVPQYRRDFTTNPNNTKTRIRYRPTRLGSSSPLYDTYKKNDYGAGAITTNPNKGGGGGFNVPQEERAAVYDSLLNRGDSSALKPENNPQ